MNRAMLEIEESKVKVASFRGLSPAWRGNPNRQFHSERGRREWLSRREALRKQLFDLSPTETPPRSTSAAEADRPLPETP